MSAVSLPADLRSVGAARRLIRTALDGRRSSDVEDAVVMISELVTNAVRHTRDVLLVRVATCQRLLRVEIADDDPTMPVVPDPERTATSGRGLRIVEALADRWGVTPAPGGKIVWFELDVGDAMPHAGAP